MIPTYHCASFLAQTLETVLAQDSGPEIMQIEVVDDHSTQDDPEAVVTRIGQGRVGFYRQPKNVGHVKNFETCLQRARGHLVHLLHGDDYVRDGFYGLMQTAFEGNPHIGAAFCRHQFVDEGGQLKKVSPLEQESPGILPDWLTKIAVSQRIQTPAMVVRRLVYESLGGFDDRLTWVEDWEMWVRIAAHYPVWYEPHILAVYREHRDSNTGQFVSTGQNIQDVRRAIGIIDQYLPCAKKATVMKQAKNQTALMALYYARHAAKRGDKHTTWVQIKEGWTCHPSFQVLLRSIHCLLLLLSQSHKRAG